MNETLEKLKSLIIPMISEQKLELYDIEYKKETQGWVLRLFIDNETRSISLDECAAFSHIASEVLDKEEELQLLNYSFEVSSPGLDRLLRNDSDFNWAMGKTLKVKFTNPKNKKETVEGKLEKINPETIELSVDKKNKIEVAKNQIESARRVMRFDELLPKDSKHKK